ncbi:MAG TPA: carboxypeptidase-like regulatory domain-containing protein [Acidisarcina sp.]|nr:carboxypeptidase-like regulatory domain-containing protein [Acidisarcina sp.]
MAVLAGAEPSTNSPVLAGIVQDSSGAVIVGAKVVLTAPDGRVITQEATDKAGSFRFGGIAPGSYSIDVAQPGFRATKQQVKVGASTRTQLRIVLPIAAVNEEITVAGSDPSAAVSTETAQNQSANTIDSQALDRLPTFDKDYITTMSRFLDSDATGTNGVTLVVNGAEANGPGVTASAIESVKIN